MLETWLPLLIFAALGGTWYHVLRLRERATAHARRLCARHGLQFLDESVALHRLRVQWRRGALRVMREYRFDTSLGGNDRQHAAVILLGDRIVGTRLPVREHVTAAPPTEAAVIAQPPVLRRGKVPGNVIPFDPERRTLH